MDRSEERVVAAGLKAGRPEAWLALYDAYAARLWGHVARLSGGNSDTAADAVQATLLAAAQSARSFDPSRGGLWNWLCGIASHQVALIHRRNRTATTFSLETCDESDVSPPADAWELWLSGEIDEPPMRLQTAEAADLVRAALISLPADYQTLLLARYVDGASAEQIATNANTTGQAIRSRLARARRALRNQLARLAPSLAADEGKP